MNVLSSKEVLKRVWWGGRAVVVPLDVFGLADALCGLFGAGVDGFQSKEGTGVYGWEVLYLQRRSAEKLARAKGSSGNSRSPYHPAQSHQLPESLCQSTSGCRSSEDDPIDGFWDVIEGGV